MGALAASVAASACCLLPTELAVVGALGSGFAAKLAPYRIYFLIATAVALGAGFWFAYRPQKDECGCATPRSRRTTRIGLWITTVLSVTLAICPLLGSGNASAGSAEVEAKATLDLDVIGMDCKECTSTIANAIKKVPGVVSATVDFETGNAEVLDADELAAADKEFLDAQKEEKEERGNVRAKGAIGDRPLVAALAAALRGTRGEGEATPCRAIRVLLILVPADAVRRRGWRRRSALCLKGST